MVIMYRKQEVVDNRSIRVGSDDSQVTLKCGTVNNFSGRSLETRSYRLT